MTHAHCSRLSLVTSHTRNSPLHPLYKQTRVVSPTLDIRDSSSKRRPARSEKQSQLRTEPCQKIIAPNPKEESDPVFVPATKVSLNYHIRIDIRINISISKTFKRIYKNGLSLIRENFGEESLTVTLAPSSGNGPNEGPHGMERVDSLGCCR